jgi:hypothetical protein
MNRKKIFLTATAVVLAAAGVFAGIHKHNVTAIYVKTAGTSHTCIPLIASNVSLNFTSTVGTRQATIRTKGGTLLPLYSTSTCSATHKIYTVN